MATDLKYITTHLLGLYRKRSNFNSVKSSGKNIYDLL
jgi:hypothetical protein